jgi:hypothetical protein
MYFSARRTPALALVALNILFHSASLNTALKLSLPGNTCSKTNLGSSIEDHGEDVEKFHSL